MSTQLASLEVNSYRSLYEFKLKLNNFNILIGRNDAGKSNVLRAIQLLLDENAASQCSSHDISKLSKEVSRYPKKITVKGSFSGKVPFEIERQILVYKDKPSTSTLRVKEETEWRFLTAEEQQAIPSLYYLRPRTGAIQEAFNPKKENHIYTLVKDWIPPEFSTKEKLNKLMRDYANTRNAMSGYVKFFEDKILGHLRMAFEADFPLLRLEVAFRSENMLFVRELTHMNAPKARLRLPLSNHGTGLVSVVALVLSIAILQEYHHQYLNDKPLLIAVEEPEVHLHPQAQRVFLRYLKWMAEKQQILITTHSPIFVDRAEPKNVVVLRRATLKDEKKTKGKTVAGSTDAKTNDYSTNWKSIKTTLGVRLSDVLMAGEVNLLVEGPTEAILLPAMAATLAEKGLPSINFERVFVVPGEGGNIPHIAELLQATGNPTVVMIDDDQAGRDYEKKLVTKEPRFEAIFKPNIKRLPPPVCQTKECEFEDLLDSNSLLIAFNETFKKVEGFEDFLPIDYHNFETEQLRLHSQNENCSWVDTINYIIDKRAKSPEIRQKEYDKRFNKRILAEKVAEFVRDGRMPVPKFCETVIAKIAELVGI